VDVYSYDHNGRLLTQKQTINNQQQEVIASNTYDNLGQLATKGVGGKITQSRLQNIDYSYNIRGWLKNINAVDAVGSDLFAFQINYNTPTSGTPLFNGNISQTFWKTANIDSSLKNYTYAYDDLNRLTQATDNSASSPGRYNEGLTYDKNGNIMSILRLGNTNPAATTFGTMDNLAYTYDSGNKLTKVEDTSGNTEGFSNGSNTATEYTYDLNGNMKTDANKGISAITYNHLSLPISISIGGGIINYVYDATGVKQRKTISTGGSTDYAGSFVYENNTLKQFSQPEGYVAYSAGIFNYIYQYKDHLGNNRISYQDKDNNGVVNSSEIVQENNYYVFGLVQKGYNGAINGVDNKYKYNGKELQDDNISGIQLNLYDYGARNYDPALGRWMNIDPLAETSRRFSPYTYALNNPVYFIDPDGMEAKNSYVHNSQNVNGRHQTWSDRHSGAFSNESNNSMFANPELPMDRLKTLDELEEEQGEGKKSTATADNLEEIELTNNNQSKVDPKLPPVVKYKNGEKFVAKNGDIYQVHLNEWVKLDGILVNASPAAVFGVNENMIGMNQPQGSKVMIDRAIHRANLKLHFNNVVNPKSIASSAVLEYLAKGTLPKYNFASTALLGLYNFFDGMYNQYNLNEEHDKTATSLRK
jgi:RHS repeat-associated protein